MGAAGRHELAPGRMTADEFCATYYDRVVGLAVHAFGGDEAYDVAHEALSRVLAAYSTLDPERDAWPWLSTIVRNAGRESLRRRRAVPLEEAYAVAAPDEAFDAMAAEEELRTLARALERMPRADRDVLLMRVRDELPFAEISRRTGRTPGALRVQAVRARQRLAEEFARLGGTAYGTGALVAAKLRARLAGIADAWPAAAQLATAVAVCGLASGATAEAAATPPAPPHVTAEAVRATPSAPRATASTPPRASRPAAARPGTPARPATAAAARVEEPVRDGDAVEVGSRVAGPGAAYDDHQRRPGSCALPTPLCHPAGTQVHVSTTT